MSPENQFLSLKEIVAAEELGGVEKAENENLEPENSPYYEDPHHAERSAYHSSNKTPHLQRIINKKNGKNQEKETLGKPFRLIDTTWAFVIRRKSRKQR